jgi:hypothetical protein
MNMLTSIPLPHHESAHNLWYPYVSPLTYTYTSVTSSAQTSHLSQGNSSNNNSNNPSTHPTTASATQPPIRQPSRLGSQTSPNGPQRTLLSVLRSDENAISQRRANIRRFGAGWLKPPGIGKTLQGIWDERIEREEAEAAAIRYDFFCFSSFLTLQYLILIFSLSFFLFFIFLIYIKRNTDLQFVS